MGILVVLAVLAVVIGAFALFARAVRADERGERQRHGWLVAGPLLVVAVGFLVTMIVRHS